MRPALLSLLLATAPAMLAPAAQAHEFTLGALEIGHPFSLATPSRTGAGYLTVTNHGAEPDALLAVEAPFPQVSLHRTEISDEGMATMPGVDRFELGAGETLTLAPGAGHVMFMGLPGPLEEGERIPAALVFERAGRVEVEFVVEPLSFVAGSGAAPDSGMPEHGGMDHGTMDHGTMDHGTDPSATR